MLFQIFSLWNNVSGFTITRQKTVMAGLSQNPVGFEKALEKVVKGPLFPLKEPLKTSVFRGFLTLWRKLHLHNSLYSKELAIFSKEPLKTQPGFPEVPLNPKQLFQN
ncbi:MAG: hypothetical protein LBK27_04825 [Treponema sp.]|jgi:hypothetical protein|nr:hypothetical protein [Treponema sp.]